MPDLALLPSIQHDIEAVEAYAANHVGVHWQGVADQNRSKLADAFARGGDKAYGTYLGLLLRPVMRRLAEAGLKVTPRLPGLFDASREWGNADETHQQRWMWSVVRTPSGRSIGALVTVIHHDHSEFRLPQPPEIFSLAANTKPQIIEALSQRSVDFRNALEFSDWYLSPLHDAKVRQVAPDREEAA
jgi:hypothetical protein